MGGRNKGLMSEISIAKKMFETAFGKRGGDEFQVSNP
jgi:hypothetical protein